jgi:uncharacterized membrane protein
MKIKILVIVVALSSQINFAQSVFPTNGANVGIGTLSPTAKLHVNNGDNSYGTILANASESTFSLYAKTLTTVPVYTEVFRLGLKHLIDENNGFISFYRGANTFGGFLGFSTNGIERIRITDTGNVGIGTDTPFSKLSIVGSLTVNGGLTNALSRPAVSPGTLVNGEIRGYSNTANSADDGFLRLSAGGGTTVGIKSYIDLSGYSTIPDMNINIVFGTSGAERMRIDQNGNIGIGTNAPDAKLAVNGNIHSREVKVDVNFPAPDYVFANDYKLITLQEVENFVNQNSHLPEIPSAKEFEKNGIQLAEMNMALLKKIEELTLYAIEQQKNTEKLTKVIEEQNKRLETLEKK